MKNYKTKIQRMSCETIATVGMRVIETITQSMAEDVKNVSIPNPPLYRLKKKRTGSNITL